MEPEPRSDLVIRAAAAYGRVVAEPETYGPEAIQLVGEARAARDPEALVGALRAEAWYHRTRFANDRAKQLLDEAARVARRHQLHARLGEVLMTRGAVNHELGRVEAAQRDFDRAGALVDPAMAAELASQQGALYQNMGRLTEAAELYRRVLAAGGIPTPARTRAANNLGLIEAQRGRSRSALGWLDQAAAAAEQVGPAYVAIVTESRAWVTVRAGRLTQGLALFDEAARLFAAAGLPLAELHTEQADALTELRLLPEAEEHAHRAHRLMRNSGVHLMAAEAQLRMAQLALLRGDAKAAAGIAEDAAQRFRRQHRPGWVAQADLVAVDARLQGGESVLADLATARRAAAALQRLDLRFAAADAYLCAGRVAVAFDRADAAVSALGRAYELSRNAPVLVRLKGRIAAALAARIQQRHDAVLQHSRAGLEDLARHRTALPSQELRALASGHGAELGRLGLESLLRSGSSGVLDWMERTRAAALSAVEPIDAEGFEEELAALRAVHAEALQLQRTTGREPVDLLARQTDLEARIRRATWTRNSAESTRGARVSPATLRRLLAGQVLVEYDVLDDQVLAAVLEPRRTRLVRLGSLAAVRFEVSVLLFALRRLARRRSPSAVAGARASADAALRRLAEMLLDPLELPGHAGLVVVPAADLQRVPWSAVCQAPVSIAPSAAIWARSAQRPPAAAAADDGVVLIAGPDVPGGTSEVKLLRDLYAAATVLVPPESTADAVTAALASARVAHLACHGRVRADNPIFSSLLLSDGPLTVHELEVRAAAPRQMVLAACESGSEVAYAGNETLGFVSSLLARGTAGLVASSIVVPDWELVPLMRGLHEGVRGGASLAVALHAARSAVDREDPATFVSWCAFNAFGAG